MIRRRPPTTPRLSPPAYSTLKSLTRLTNTDEGAVIESALDLLFLALTKAPQAVADAARPRTRGPWRMTSTRPISIAHLLTGLERKGALKPPKKGKTPYD